MLRQETISLLMKRRISPETAARYGLESCGKGFDIKIPFVQNGRTVNWKYRTLQGDKRFKQEKNAIKCWWNEDCLRDPTLAGEPVIITEGELDALSAIDAGYPRTISVPDGAPSTVLDKEASNKYSFISDETLDLIRSAPAIILATDGDPPGQILRNDLQIIIDEPGKTRWVKYPESQKTGYLKDLNAAAMAGGSGLVKMCIENAPPIPVSGIYLENELPEMPQYPAYATGLPGLDSFWKIRAGDLTIVTGVPGHGKSSFVVDIMCRVVDRVGWRVCIMSLENDPRSDLRAQITAWKGGARARDLSGQDLAAIARWRRDNFVYLLPKMDDTADMEWLISHMKVAVQRYGCKLFIIDPWNELDHIRSKNQSLTEYVGEAIKTLKAFCVKYGVHLIVVAHPAKPSRFVGKEWKPDIYDISDSAHWYNKCDAAMVVWRDYDTDVTEVMIKKIKYQNVIGRPGSFTAKFDWKTSKYYPAMVGGPDGETQRDEYSGLDET